jgi:hypothetical protein
MKLSNLIICAASLAASVALAAQAPLTTSSAATVPPFSTKTPMTATTAASPSRITTLDVMGIGLSLEMFRQSDAWKELQKHPNDSILPTDLSAYETNFMMKDLITDKRAADVLEYGASHFVEYWPIPGVSVWPYCSKKEVPDPADGEPNKTSYAFFHDRIDDLRMPAGMPHHEIATLGAYFSNTPDNILENAFQFFDANPQVPALLLLVSDGDMTRGYVGDMSREDNWSSGPRRFDSMTESFVVLVLARRERVDQYLRPFAWHSKARSGDEYDKEHDAHAKLMQSNAAKGSAFKPSKFLPFPWSDMQIQQFDHLPTIAVLHRPIRVTYRKDKDGKPTFDPKQQAKLMAAQQREAVFKAGFDDALKEIPGGKPARVFYDAGNLPGNTSSIPLSLAVHHSLPEFDLPEPDLGYDIFRRIGNTGAASPFVQWALASMASFQKKDASITVNLRQKEEATITVVTPSADKQQHPMGHPFDFNLAPQDGGPAVPVAPPAPVKPHASNTAAPPPSRAVPLGLSLRTGDTCPITGMWRCEPSDDSGHTHSIYGGKTFPQVTVTEKRKLGFVEKKLGKQLSRSSIDATWTLVNYVDGNGRVIKDNG